MAANVIDAYNHNSHQSKLNHINHNSTDPKAENRVHTVHITGHLIIKAITVHQAT